jgi:hypothetical protein
MDQGEGRVIDCGLREPGVLGGSCQQKNHNAGCHKKSDDDAAPKSAGGLSVVFPDRTKNPRGARGDTGNQSVLFSSRLPVSARRSNRRP